MEAKVFNDPIHGLVKIPALCIKIIDTPQFQRLRRIKQLGGVYHVYYGASHNRFEHSIGVCHLAGRLLKHLKSEQPELKIDDRDILCVEIAGLCHDLGHGPFSHLWDLSILRGLNKLKWKLEEGSVAIFDQLVAENKLRPEFARHLGLNSENEKDLNKALTFVKELISGRKHEDGFVAMFDQLLAENKLTPESAKHLGLNSENEKDLNKALTFIKELISGRKHEDGSVAMFDQLVAENKLRPEFAKHLGLNSEHEEDLNKELTFIKELISGRKTGKNGSWEGRPESKAFLYEVIANKENGIDVDKWDYFARDCYYLGLPKSFDHQRLMSFARVLSITKDNPDHKQICYRDKEASNVYGMFYTRSLLHQKAYKHKTVKAIECMLTDAILCSNTLLKFRGKDGDMKSLVETAYDMEAFVQVDDEVIGQIMKMSSEVLKSEEDKENLRKAKEILERIEKRQIYRCLLSDPVDSKELKFDIKKATEELVKVFNEKLPQALIAEDFSVERVSYDYGMKDENPVDKVYFYGKSQSDLPKKISIHEVSMMLPKTFSETRILLLYKKFTPEEGHDKKLFDKVTDCFKEYCKLLTKPEVSESNQ